MCALTRSSITRSISRDIFKLLMLSLRLKAIFVVIALINFSSINVKHVFAFHELEYYEGSVTSISFNEVDYHVILSVGISLAIEHSSAVNEEKPPEIPFEKIYSLLGQFGPELFLSAEGKERLLSNVKTLVNLHLNESDSTRRVREVFFTSLAVFENESEAQNESESQNDKYMFFVDLLILLVIFLSLMSWIFLKLKKRLKEERSKYSQTNRKKKEYEEKDNNNTTSGEDSQGKNNKTHSQPEDDDSFKPNDTAEFTEPNFEDELSFFNLTSDYTVADLKKARNQKLKENHPDKVSHMSDEIRDLAERQTQRINIVYEKLRERLLE